MDPDETFYNLLEALADGENDLAEEAATDLIEWIGRGGAKPKALSASLELAKKETSHG